MNEPREKFPDEMPEDIFDEYTLEDYLDDMDNLDGDDYGDEGPLFPGGR